MTERAALELGPWHTRRVDAASLVIVRVVVGLLVFVSAARFVAKGWVESLLLEPSFQFRYGGFAWVPVPSAAVTYALFALVGLAGLALAAGVAARASAVTACVAFTWIELIDASYYLNHYYFVSCLLLTLALVGPRPEGDGAIPAWKLGLVRAQVGLVYVYAGVAKLHADWLLEAQPLKIWLARHADLPVVGAWMDEAWLAYAASWSGAVFDLAVVPALACARTRAPAYVALIGFHGLTGALFPIGLFPWIMIGCATIWFEPDWPRRWLAPATGFDHGEAVNPRVERVLGALAMLGLAVQLALPWRHLAYPDSVLWHEQGARFAYRVMVVEKAGSVSFRVHDRTTGETSILDPCDTELTMLQAKMMSTRPDHIAAYARDLAARIEGADPDARIEVYVDAFVAVNGRPSARLIDPNVDLAAVEDSLAAKPWILPAPEGLR